MKTRFFLLGMVLLFGITSCKKDEETYTEYKNCKCGTIANDGITNSEYWIDVRNECSGNKKRVVMDADLWMDAHIGQKRCYSETW